MEKNANGSEAVEAYLSQLEHPRLEEIILLRSYILEAADTLSETIKWNAPSFVLKGEDCLTMRIHPPKHVQLIFHRGSKPKSAIEEPMILDPNKLLTWAANDRAVATFADKEDLEAKKEMLQAAIRAWLTAMKHN